MLSPASLQVHLDIPIFVSNAVAAFGLNMSVFMLIGKTSALTMNIAGVIKDWLLIGLSVLIFKAQVRYLAASLTTCSLRIVHCCLAAWWHNLSEEACHCRLYSCCCS